MRQQQKRQNQGRCAGRCPCHECKRTPRCTWAPRDLQRPWRNRAKFLQIALELLLIKNWHGSPPWPTWRSEEHTSELQSHHDLVCRLLLEKKKKNKNTTTYN